MSTEPHAEICFGVETKNQSLNRNLLSLKFERLELKQQLMVRWQCVSKALNWVCVLVVCWLYTQIQVVFEKGLDKSWHVLT